MNPLQLLVECGILLGIWVLVLIDWLDRRNRRKEESMTESKGDYDR